MERIEPEIFSGPRAYFTNFDSRIVGGAKNLELLRSDIERKLKILLLTKNNIVCAASHLTSEFTYKIFKDNPILLNSGIIIPALRRDKNDFHDLFVKLELPKKVKNEMVGFYKNEVRKTVNWDLYDNSAWFRNCFLTQLKKEDSIIRRNLSSLSEPLVNAIIHEIEKDELLARDKIDVIANTLKQDERDVLINFRELLYHMSGARVINCQSTLPQENYIQYGLADTREHKIILSDAEIFRRYFIELICESLHGMIVPLSDLDKLTFEEVITMRTPIEKSKFRQLYDDMVEKTVRTIKKDSETDLFIDLENLLKLDEKLRSEFKAEIEKELNIKRKNTGKEESKILLKSTMLWGWGIIPIISTGKNVYDAIVQFINCHSYIKNQKTLQKLRLEEEQIEQFIKKKILKSDIIEKTELADVFDLVIASIQEKYPRIK